MIIKQSRNNNIVTIVIPLNKQIVIIFVFILEVNSCKDKFHWKYVSTNMLGILIFSITHNVYLNYVHIQY